MDSEPPGSPAGPRTGSAAPTPIGSTEPAPTPPGPASTGPASTGPASTGPAPAGQAAAAVASAPQATTAVLVRALLPSLSPAERRVADVVLDDSATASSLTISELAERAETSETTVIRFCRALGFSGYPSLRLTLAKEAGRAESGAGGRRTVGSDIGPTDGLAEVVEKVAFADARAVEETAAQVDVAVLGAVIDAIVGASRVDIYGVGASAFVAADFQQKLHRIGRIAYAWSDVHIALTSAALLAEGDVAVGISHTGVTSDTVEALQVARERGATTVAVTNFPRSPISGVADLVLTTAARETTFRSGAMSSRIAQLSLVDCIFVGVAQRTYEQTQDKLRVTRDAVVGRRLTGKSGRQQ